MSDTAARSTGDARPTRSVGPEPRKGDKVRLVIEGEVGSTYASAALGFKNGPVIPGYVVQSAKVEILERADDPSKDPVGTVRRSVSLTYTKSEHAGCNGNLPWVRLTGDGNVRTYSDGEVVGLPVIGAVPGTPAAEAAEEPLAEWERELLEPEYEYYRGEPHPLAYRLHGDTVEYYSDDDASWKWDGDDGWWAGVIRKSWTRLDGKPSDVG